VTLVLLAAVPVAGLAALFPAQEWAGATLALLCTRTNELMVACGRLAPAPLGIPQPNPWLYYGGLLVGWRYRHRPAAWAAAAVLVAVSFFA
jgi:hypothetical protein